MSAIAHLRSYWNARPLHCVEGVATDDATKAVIGTLLKEIEERHNEPR